MTELSGKSLIVSGASKGIGRELALILAEKGVNLVLNARTHGPLQGVSQECKDKGAHVDMVSGSIASPTVAGGLVHAARQLGSFLGFIHVAGVLHPGPTLWELSDKAFNDVFEASVDGAFQLIHHAYPSLQSQGDGLAVFFGSGASEIAQPGISAYCAAKAAEEHLMRQAAAEAPEILAFAYRPSIVETRMQVQARESEGGASENLHEVFRPWKNNGDLIEPAEAARGLLRFLDMDRETLHGRVVDYRQL